MKRVLLVSGLSALALVTTPYNHGAVRASSPFAMSLSAARVDSVAGGQVAVSFLSADDIRGLLSLTIEPNGATERGSARGEWVLVSRYHQDLTPEGQPDPDPEASRHEEHEYFELHERGTMRGAITGGTLVYGADGQLTGIESLALSIDGGSMEFEGAKGTGSASNIDFSTGLGKLQLDATMSAEVR